MISIKVRFHLFNVIMSDPQLLGFIIIDWEYIIDASFYDRPPNPHPTRPYISPDTTPQTHTLTPQTT